MDEGERVRLKLHESFEDISITLTTIEKNHLPIFLRDNIRKEYLL
jgi:hypothetical protein